MSTTPPLVSVIVPVHDVAAHVGAAMASLRAQILPDFEALVIDDGSTDDSADRAQAAIAGDPRFRLLRQPNRGLSAARNAGIAQARGTFLAFLDGDDAFAPDFLNRLCAACRDHGTDWAASGVMLVHPDGVQVPHPGWHGAGSGSGAVIDLADARRVQPLFPSAWNKVWRRAVFGDLRFPEGLWFEDHEVFWRMAARAPRLAWVPEALVLHRRGRAGQITGLDDDRALDILAVLDRLHPHVTGGDFAHGATAFDRLATRLLHERAAVLAQPERRGRFLAAARQGMARWCAGWNDAGDPDIARGLALELAGEVPLSLLVPEGAPWPKVPGAEVVRLSPGTDLAQVARGLKGRYVLALAPGEGLLPGAADLLINRAEETGAPAAMGGLMRPGGAYHDGWCDNRILRRDGAGTVALGPDEALRLFPALGNRALRREVLATMQDAPPWHPDAVTVQALALAMARAAGRLALTDRPVLALGPPLPLGKGFVRRLRLVPAGGPLPRGARGVLALRLAGLAGRGGPFRLIAALRLGLMAPPAAARPDPDTPLWLRLAMLAPRRAPVAPGPAARDNRTTQD